jgi:protein SCO1
MKLAFGIGQKTGNGVLCWIPFLALVCVLAPFVAEPVHAQEPLTDVKGQVGFDQHPNAQVPGDLVFRDDKGQVVQLGDYLSDKPVILTLNYFNCPNLCTFEIDQLGEALAKISWNLGQEYQVVTVSFDPRDGTDLAQSRKWEAIRHYARPGLGDGWHFLTGDASAVASLTQAIGFRYAYNAETDEFAHPIGLFILTPQGRLYRYLYGDDFDPTAIRLGLVEASQNKLGTVIDQMLLVCYHYDPTLGKYSSAVLQISQIAGVATILVMGGILTRWWRHDLRQDAEYLKHEAQKD